MFNSTEVGECFVANEVTKEEVLEKVSYIIFLGEGEIYLKSYSIFEDMKYLLRNSYLELVPTEEPNYYSNIKDLVHYNKKTYYVFSKKLESDYYLLQMQISDIIEDIIFQHFAGSPFLNKKSSEYNKILEYCLRDTLSQSDLVYSLKFEQYHSKILNHIS